MHFLLQTEEDIATIISKMSERGDHRGPRQILADEQMQAHATENGMVIVFVGDMAGPGERSRVMNLAAATEAALTREVTVLADGYRRMIREDLPNGRNLAVKSALSRVRAQERFLAGLDMADQSDACELLGLSKANPSATLKRIEDRGELIRIERDGRPMYPLFQFDTEARRIYPAILEINRLRPAHWSNIRLCYWMTRAHADFARAPAELLGEGDEEIIDAFRRAIEPEIQGLMPVRIGIDLTDPVPENFRAPDETVLRAGTELHRLHNQGYGACQFNDSDRGNARFSPIRNAAGKIIPTIYAAQNFRCAVCEIILRAPDAHPAPGTQTAVFPSDFKHHQHSGVRTLGDLRLLNLTATGQRSIGLVGNALLGGGKLHYPVTRAWAEAIHAHVPWAQGIFYTSYQAGPEFALMLFGDRCVDALEQVGTSRPVRAATVDDEIRTIAGRIGIDYIDL